MGYRILFLVSVSFVPLLLIASGKIFAKFPSKEPNIALGFRTKLSMKNKDTWNYAQELFPKVWIKLGSYLLPISIAVMYVMHSDDKDFTGSVAVAIMLVQALAMLVSIYSVNQKLKKAFNSDGTRKQFQ